MDQKKGLLACCRGTTGSQPATWGVQCPPSTTTTTAQYSEIQIDDDQLAQIDDDELAQTDDDELAVVTHIVVSSKVCIHTNSLHLMSSTCIAK